MQATPVAIWCVMFAVLATPALAQRAGMKLYISADMEGVVGTTHDAHS